MVVSASSAARCSSIPPVDSEGDHVTRRLADVGDVEQLAGAVQPDDLIVTELARDVARLGVGGHAPALGEVAVEEVDDAVEGLGG
jgi:hypothetical protein